MRNASGHQGEMSGSRKKVKKNAYENSPIKRVTRKFMELSGSFTE